MTKRARKKRKDGTRRRRWLELVKANGTRQRRDWKILFLRWDARGRKAVIKAGTPFTIQSVTICM